jgi:hypothetical protein
MHKTNDPFTVLRVSPNAETAEIKAAYKRLIKQLHPDVNKSPKATDEFKTLVFAYQEALKRNNRSESSSAAPAMAEETQSETTNKRKVTKSLPALLFRWVPKLGGKEKSQTQLDQLFTVQSELLSLPAEELYRRFSSSENKYVRMESLKALVYKEKKRSFRYLLPALNDISKEVRKVAIISLGALRIRQGIQPMLALYQKSGVELRKEIIHAILAFRLPHLQTFIAQCCFDTNPEIQITALHGINQTNLLETYRDFLTPLLHDQNPTVQKYAQQLLKK